MSKPIKYVVARVKADGTREYASVTGYSIDRGPTYEDVPGNFHPNRKDAHKLRYHELSRVWLGEGEFVVPLLPRSLARRPTRAYLENQHDEAVKANGELHEKRNDLKARVRELELTVGNESCAWDIADEERTKYKAEWMACEGRLADAHAEVERLKAELDEAKRALRAQDVEWMKQCEAARAEALEERSKALGDAREALRQQSIRNRHSSIYMGLEALRALTPAPAPTDPPMADGFVLVDPKMWRETNARIAGLEKELAHDRTILESYREGVLRDGAPGVSAARIEELEADLEWWRAEDRKAAGARVRERDQAVAAARAEERQAIDDLICDLVVDEGDEDAFHQILDAIRARTTPAVKAPAGETGGAK